MSAPLLLPALDSLIPKLATCQYFTCDKYVSIATFSSNSFFQMMWLANFQLANSQTFNSQTRWLAARTLPRLGASYPGHDGKGLTLDTYCFKGAKAWQNLQKQMTPREDSAKPAQLLSPTSLQW